MVDAPDSEWFARVAHNGGLIFFTLRVEPDIAYEYVSDAIGDLLGVTADEAMADATIVHERVVAEYQDALAGALACQPGRSTAVELTWKHRNGHALHTRCHMQARQRPDGSRVLEGTVAEITELRDVETELRHSEQRHRLLAENAWDVVWTMGLDGSITYVSPAVERVRGITPQEAMKQSLDEIHPPDSAASVGAYFAELFAAIADGTEPPVFRGEHEYYRHDGSIMTGELQVIPHVDDDGKVVAILGVTRDISERKVFESELTRLAVTDPLTGLWNRRHTAELLAADLLQSERHGQTLSLLMIDIDHFKAINDTHGHQTGDRVLIEVARRLLDNVRATDVIGRWGGEEFVVLLRFCGRDDALATAEKLRRRISDTPVTVAGPVTVSIGASELCPGDDISTWLSRADAALYEAKRSGRNAVAG